jgi:membrane-associated protease RseP (regulator of RpoE activity)
LNFACINLILFTFNLLPIKRLDGGMALYFWLSQKINTDVCRKILNFLSCFFIGLIYLWGIYVFVSSQYNLSVLIVAIFLTLSMFSPNEY